MPESTEGVAEGPQFSGTHMAQVGAVVAAVGAPVFLLPAGVAGSTVDQLVQLLRIVYAIVHREIILKAAVIFPGRLAAGDTRWAQIRNIPHAALQQDGGQISDHINGEVEVHLHAIGVCKLQILHGLAEVPVLFVQPNLGKYLAEGDAPMSAPLFLYFVSSFYCQS